LIKVVSLRKQHKVNDSSVHLDIPSTNNYHYQLFTDLLKTVFSADLQ